MMYTSTDVLCRTSFLADLDVERITYFLFLSQYGIYRIGSVKVVIKYMYAGQPITRVKFYIGHKFIVQMDTDLPDISELIKPYKLPPPVEDRIFKTWAKYHDEPTQKLRHTIRKKLGLIPIEKQKDYLGVDVDKYFETERFKIIKKEI
jgi:hypothetical protein